MSNIVIKAENVSKMYHIGRHQAKSSFSDVISEISKLPKKIFNKTEKPEEFWALKDVSFEINKGDVVGIIGKNGSGKSTLLKILSRITEPTEGQITMKGRVASLLEVGTGFNPELTGRENIFLNGSILGMTRQEIRNHFDEIVEFSGVEKFLDTPVKRYSSGMYVRLAFAVAAHLESEILLIDEILSVGDAEFQKKCLGKMNNLAKSGRTVFLVSHQMNTIEKICNSCLYLQNGTVKLFSRDVRKAVKSYLFGNRNIDSNTQWVNPNPEKELSEYFTPLSMSLCNKKGELIKSSITNNEDVYIQFELNIKETDPTLNIGYVIFNGNSTVYWTLHTDTADNLWPKLKKGKGILRSKLPKRLLNEGNYKIALAAGLHFRKFLFNPNEDSPYIKFTIHGNLSDSSFWTIKRPGFIAPIINWEYIEQKI